VLVPHGELRGQIQQRPFIGPSPDVILITANADTIVKKSIRVASEVRLVLGDNVRITAYGLDAKPTGSILTIVNPLGPTIATGELRVENGTYRAYGVNLDIEHGRLIFGGGPIGNPGLDVRAVRTASDGVVAGFEVRGTLQKPRFSVFSDPPMAERDAIAYAVLGRPLDRTNQSESGIVSDAANTLGLRGGSYIAGTLARQLGLDQASVESRSGSFDDAALSLGTFLSPRIYVNYGVGILDQVSTLRIQYFMNKKWTLQAEAGPENSAQVLYTVERGR